MKDKQLNFLAFWAINDELVTEKACTQLLEMKRLGLNGVIFHPRNYSGKPEYLGEEYMRILSDIILHAKSIGMEFWLYDENGFPSGTASGKVLLENPDAKCMWMEYSDGKAVLHEKNAVSTLDEKVCRDFVRITFEGYKRGLSPEAFDYFTGVFSDEVAFLDGVSASVKYGGVPWCEVLEDRYRKKYGESITDRLPLLLEDGEEYETIRENYWQLISEMLRDNFYAPIHKWCQDNHKLYTAHLKGEENIFFNISYDGSPYEILQEVSIPAVDALERYPGNHYYPHIASSIAKQFYDGRCLCEAMGGSGWGTSPQDFIRYMEWLIDCGINSFTFHLSQYTLNSQAIQDWPPSVPFHVSWKEAFPEVLCRIREYAAMFEKRKAGSDSVLIVAPTRGCMRYFVPKDAMKINEHNGAGVPDTAAGKISNEFNELVEQCYKNGMLYDVTDEKVLEESGQISEEGIRIGKMHYRKVILGKGCRFHDQKILRKIKEYGLEATISANENPVKHENLLEWNKLGEDAGEWKVLQEGENQLLLDCNNRDDDILQWDIAMEDMDKCSGMCLVSSDPLDAVRVNDRELENREDRYEIPEALFDTDHLCIEITLPKQTVYKPFLFLQGDFLVKNKKEYYEKNGRQLYTQGEFYLSGRKEQICSNKLVQAGFPFRKAPVVLEKRFFLPEGTDRLKLSDFRAAAAHVRIDEEEPVWIFSEEESVRIPERLQNRECILRVEVYPSTYNMYGSHHHIDGDRHLISPAQYSGHKNFADFPDSPECTLVNGYHFVKFGLGNAVAFETENV